VTGQQSIEGIRLMDQAEGMQHQSSIAPMATPIQAQGVPEEKVLKQSEVDELVFRLKHEAYEKGKRDAHVQNPQSALEPAGQSMGGMPQVTEDHVRQMIADEAQKQTQMAGVQQTLSNFVDQMKAGKGKYSDFDETVAKLGNFQNIPHIVKMATDTGIAGDVIYELGRNPGKVASLTTLAYINPQLAEHEMKKLVDSIKTNDQASKEPSVSEPLSQVKPSTVGTDNGSNSVRDLRRKSWAKG
jgi:hypothetical protein